MAILSGRVLKKWETKTVNENELRDQLYASFKHRAILYYVIYDELRQELGSDRACAILKRAIYRRGEMIGQQFYKEFAPGDFKGLCDAFVGNVPDDGAMFAPRVDRCDEDGLDVVLQSCPLRDAWIEMGLSDEEAGKICEIAAEIDFGTFEGAGFELTAQTWQPGSECSCHLHIRPSGKG